MLVTWLCTLTDDFLVAWSSRGHVRRARKLLDGLEPDAIVLEAGQARGSIDGHRQTLTGIGFDHAECSCPATGRCHHLVCFLLGLHAVQRECQHQLVDGRMNEMDRRRLQRLHEA